MYAENVPNGIAVVFSARTSSPAQVLAQVEALSKEIEINRNQPGAETGQPSTFSTRQLAEFSSSSRVTPTDDGARLILIAKDPDQTLQLRARVLWQMSAFLPDSRDRSGLCPVVPRQAADRREQQMQNQRSSR